MWFNKVISDKNTINTYLFWFKENYFYFYDQKNYAFRELENADMSFFLKIYMKSVFQIKIFDTMQISLTKWVSPRMWSDWAVSKLGKRLPK